MNESNHTRRLSIRHPRAFVAVAEWRSLTRAAEALFVTQSALSLTIQHLEQHLGLPMFDRSTRRLGRTSAADEFLPTARRLIQEFDASINGMRALGKRERGRVGVAAVPSVLTLLSSEAAAAFIDKFPGVDLYLREDNSESVQQRILSGDVDFGVCSPWGGGCAVEFRAAIRGYIRISHGPRPSTSGARRQCPVVRTGELSHHRF
jgi:DNA-binding transcriptional LysR family regulator